MDYEGSSEGGPKGSFENFKSEGDVHYKQNEYKKALGSYNMVSIIAADLEGQCPSLTNYITI